MKALTLEIEKVDDTRLWYGLMARCQEMANRVWALWFAHHFAANSADAIRKHLDALASWRKADAKTRGDKPTLAVQCFSTELANEIYHDIRKNFPDVNVRTAVLMQNILRGRIIKRKASKGSLSGWMAILLGKENIPSSIHPVPVPFDKQNSKVWLDGKKVKVKVRAAREERDDKRGVSIESEFALVTYGRAARYAEPIHAIAAGQSKLAGCSVMYKPSARKWFVIVAYKPPEEPPAQVDPERVLFVRPGSKEPLQLRCQGKLFRLGHGEVIGRRRRQVIASRLNRQNNYRWTATSTKGHSRNRALEGVFKLKQSWNFFAKTFNQQAANRTRQIALSRGAGKVVLLFKHSARSLLATAGKIEDHRDSTAWPFYQLEKLIRDALHPHGIEVVSADQVREAVG